MSGLLAVGGRRDPDKMMGGLEMTERTQRVRRSVFRAVAAATMLDLGFLSASDKLFPSLSHRLANSPLGMLLLLWALVAPIALALYVGYELWRGRNVRLPREVTVDLVLAAVCLVSLVGLVMYVVTHYPPI